ncbi:MAG: hypothetical protein HWE13_15100 [Gammaproteobacteria bacterium]|nr:hypothetical protein [Gammaproteobacteria bacterium]NVK89463.1 hypothetical protein [Gammaproteobacteria bacterium]
MQTNKLLITAGVGLAIIASLNGAAIAFGYEHAQFLSRPWLSTWFAGYSAFLAIAAAGLIRHRKTAEASAAPVEPKFKRYFRRMLTATLLYVMAIIGSHFLLQLTDQVLIVAAITLLPITPCYLMLRAIQQLVKEMDELQLRIFMESCLFALAWTAMGCITIGFFQFYKVLPNFSIFWVFSAICMLFGIGSAMAHRRYQ